MKDLPRVSGIAQAIHLIRSQRVMLDTDLARIYGVTTKRLNEQVKRNRKRFPVDFVFRLTQQEWARRGTRPYAFTEPGAVMVPAILNNSTATQATVRVVRAFACLREETLKLPTRPGYRFTLYPPIWAKA